MQIKNNRGFTLIELLIVISIIGFLAASIIFAFNIAKIKSRDAKRLADMYQVQTALKLYYDDYETYPVSAWMSNEDCNMGGSFMLFLQSYLSSSANDPSNNDYFNHGCYWYSHKKSGQGYILLMTPEDSALLDDDMDCYPFDLSYYCMGENW